MISICAMEAGKMNTYNVIPRFVKMVGTVRTYRKETQKALVVERLKAVVANTAAAFGSTGEVNFIYGYPATINHAREACLPRSGVACLVPTTSSPKFSRTPVVRTFPFFLESVPGGLHLDWSGHRQELPAAPSRLRL